MGEKILQRRNVGGNPTVHPSTLHEDNSTQILYTDRPYTWACLHPALKTVHELTV